MIWKRINVEQVAAQISYDPLTGEFTWKVSKRGPVKAGDRAGSIGTKGYWRVKINQSAYLGQRLAWALYHGVDSEFEIDHIDGDPLNNRIDNLREATRPQNCRNVKGSGVRYEPDRQRWLARITVNYRGINLGRYHTEAEAVAAVNAARVKYFGEFARVSR